MTEFGVAVVGTGGVSALHLASVPRFPGARLVGVCDVDPGRARTAAVGAGEGVAWTTSLDECLAWKDVQGVIVCTPNDTHASIGMAVLGAGHHLLMEKPIALDLAGADSLIDAATARGLVVMPGQTHRFYDPGRTVRQAIVRGDIGRPTYARSSLLAGWIWGGWGSWVLDPTRSGGHILHNGIHGLDLVTWWLDDRPLEVLASGARQTSSALGIADHFSVHVRYASGAVAIVEISRAARPKSIVVRESAVTGTRGILRQSMVGGGGMLVDDVGAAPLGFDAQEGFDREVAAWIAAARDGAALPVTAEEGRQALAMALAGERSLRSGRPVRVETER